jgi:hypothetical protein
LQAYTQLCWLNLVLELVKTVSKREILNFFEFAVFSSFPGLKGLK